MADAVKGSTHASMFVVPKGFEGAGDKWTVGLVDLSPAGSNRFNATQRPISPQPGALGAETVSLSGFGFP